MSKQAKSTVKPEQGRANKRLAFGLMVFVGCMIGMAYAAVPLYQLFCQVTGYGGTTQVAQSEAAEILDRQITVRFDANVSGGLNWDFKPSNEPVTLNVGETGQVAYEVVNLGTAPSAGTSTFNVTPQAAGIYFNKLECFCFTEQTVQAGETISMPVIFFVDPDIDEDPQMASIDTITLSYTFFPLEKDTASLTTEKEIGKADNGSSTNSGAAIGAGSS